MNWSQIEQCGRRVDAYWARHGLTMTMGAEPTYLDPTQADQPEWSLAALGETKLARAQLLAQRLLDRFAPQGLLQHSQGKWYPGEDAPRWALRCLWHQQEPLRLEGRKSWSPRQLLTFVCGQLKVPASFCRQVDNHDSTVLLLAHGPDSRGGMLWHSAPWPGKRLRLVECPGPAGMRLPWTDECPIKTALCVSQATDGLEVFLPPLASVSAWLELLQVLRQSQARISLHGYAPPIPNLEDEGVAGFHQLSVTPDPGVIEVNLHPAASWDELVSIVLGVDEEARACGLASHRFGRDGSWQGSGGGCHVVVGGPSPRQSPFAHRPDFLRSILVYWNHHPALSYLFSGLFVGPTCQAPRVDEARHEALYELELAFRELEGELEPAMLGRIFRDLLVDVSGNGHRSEICVDKLFDPVAPGGQQGLLEFRALEMPPDPHMNLTLMLLLRALLGRLWKSPVQQSLRRLGTQLHDRYMLPTFLWDDLLEVLADLREHGLELEPAWFHPHFEFRFPLLGSCRCAGVLLQLRQALEPWPVLGDGVRAGGTSRPVDSSLQRVEVRLSGLNPERHRVACNGHLLPLHDLGQGEWLAAVRFRAWQFAHSLHPTLGVQSPLRFDLLEGDRILGSCRYHTLNRDGQAWESLPASAEEAESRRACRFEKAVRESGESSWSEPLPNPEFPLTLDLRLAVLA
ncbi:MAG: transglutaminase family protein [Candidatus Eremiobacteraeota bacterium]|nr:transglutaminase family protein [Candidatus Eremiobacteraeota bacterium]MCW5867694.1 transglutaminase family protein [Candidatus Eremiobacteraeota bacterium]